MRVPIFEAIAGTTIKLTWTNSGVTPSAIGFALRDKDETIVNSAAAVNSGNGHYYYPMYIPSSWPTYIAEAIAIIDTRTYVSRGLVRRIKLEAN